MPIHPLHVDHYSMGEAEVTINLSALPPDAQQSLLRQLQEHTSSPTVGPVTIALREARLVSGPDLRSAWREHLEVRLRFALTEPPDIDFGPTPPPGDATVVAGGIRSDKIQPGPPPGWPR